MLNMITAARLGTAIHMEALYFFHVVNMDMYWIEEAEDKYLFHREFGGHFLN